MEIILSTTKQLQKVAKIVMHIEGTSLNMCKQFGVNISIDDVTVSIKVNCSYA